MDYLDRFFEPAAYRPGPVFAATDPVPNTVDHVATTEPVPQPSAIRAMEPISNPGDYRQTAERSTQVSSVRAAEARSNPASPSATDAESRTRQLVRQNPWVTRFWMELTPAQQARVERQLHRGNVRLAAAPAESAAIWDPMGLSDRVGLVFGRGVSSEPPEPPQQRDGSTLAGNS